MLEVSRTMLTLDKAGLLFAGKHLLIPTDPQTGRVEIEDHLLPALTKLSGAYMRPMNEALASIILSAAKAWNRGDSGRAAHDLIYARLPDPQGNADFYERLSLVDDALAKGETPGAIMKALNMNAPWMDEARIPPGSEGGGEWTDVSTNDVSPAQRKRWKDKVKALPQSSLDALKTAMQLENLPMDQFDDMAWIMAQESQGVPGARNSQGGSASGLFQLMPSNYGFYPNGAASLGNAVEEAQGAICYMRYRYKTAAKAKAAWIHNYHKHPKNPYW